MERIQDSQQISSKTSVKIGSKIEIKIDIKTSGKITKTSIKMPQDRNLDHQDLKTREVDPCAAHSKHDVRKRLNDMK